MSIYIEQKRDGIKISDEDDYIFISNEELKEFYKDLGEYINV